MPCLGDGCYPTNSASLSWASDAINIYLDKNSTHVHSTSEKVFINYDHNRLTHTTVQLFYQFGANESPTELGLVQTLDDNTRPIQRLSFEQAAAQWGGLVAETITLDNGRKAQEWFIPWREVLETPIPVPGTSGDMLAFAVGYNDADGGADAYDALRWRNAADPFKRVPRPGGGPYIPAEPWGDIQIVDELLSGESFLTVLSPQAGQALQAGAPATLRWLIAPPQAVDIRYSADSGKTWMTAGEQIAADSLRWIAPENPSQTCMLSIQSSSDSTLSAVSGLFAVFDAMQLVDSTNVEYRASGPPILHWHTTETDAGYRLQIASGRTSAPVVDTVIADTAYTVDSLAYGNWLWRVSIAEAGAEFSEWSALYLYDTRIPERISPVNGKLAGTTPTFRWRAIQDAGGYHIEVDDDRSFESLLFSTSVADTALRSPLSLPEGTFYWRVRIENGQRSPADSFVVSTALKAAVGEYALSQRIKFMQRGGDILLRAAFSSAEALRIRLFQPGGALIFERLSRPTAGMYTLRIPASHLSPGLYIGEADNGTQRVRKPFIIRQRR